jgi:hypothetical protein
MRLVVPFGDLFGDGRLSRLSSPRRFEVGRPCSRLKLWEAIEKNAVAAGK